MKITEDSIMDYIIDNNDNYHKIVMMRLYDEYQKYKLINEDEPREVSLLKLKSAFNAIITKINGLTDNDLSYLNDNNLKALKNDAAMLDIYLSNFDFRNKSKVQHCVNLITKLESFLKLPITFSFNLEDYIIEELNNTTDNSLPKRMKR